MKKLVDSCAIGKGESRKGEFDCCPVDIVDGWVGQFVFVLEVLPIVGSCYCVAEGTGEIAHNCVAMHHYVWL